RQHPPGVPDKGRQQLVFERREFHGPSAAPQFAAREVQLRIPEPENVGAAARRPPQVSLHTRSQFARAVLMLAGYAWGGVTGCVLFSVVPENVLLQPQCGGVCQPAAPELLSFRIGENRGICFGSGIHHWVIWQRNTFVS